MVAIVPHTTYCILAILLFFSFFLFNMVYLSLITEIKCVTLPINLKGHTYIVAYQRVRKAFENINKVPVLSSMYSIYRVAEYGRHVASVFVAATSAYSRGTGWLPSSKGGGWAWLVLIPSILTTFPNLNGLIHTPRNHKWRTSVHI